MSEDDSTADPLAEGFRNPPDRVTEPCLTYIARVIELRDFVRFYFNFIKTSAELGKYIPEAELENLKPSEQVTITYNYSTHRHFVNQVMLSRAVESFDLYLTTILRDVFIAKPELLKSEGAVDVALVIEAGSYQALIWQIVERKVQELSYKSLIELRKFILSRTGIDLFPSQAAFEMTVLASEVRNLIAHNDCRVNEIFVRRTQGISSTLEVSDTGRVRIEDDWLRRASYTLDGIVFRFDELVAQKFDLRTLFRMGSFILRS